MFMEEFQEVDVLWPEYDRDKESNSQSQSTSTGHGTQQKASKRMKIPSKPAYAASYNSNIDDDDDGGGGGSDGGMIPPHVIVARRMTGKMAFSVCSGNGRTLKGRDLSQVRNSILHMTGFLET